MKKILAFIIAVIFSFIAAFSAAASDSTPLTADEENAIINDAFYRVAYDRYSDKDKVSFDEYKERNKLSDEALFLFYGRYGADNSPLVFISDLKIFGSAVYNIGDYQVKSDYYASGPECINTRGFFLYRAGALVPLADAYESGLMTDGDLGELCRSEFAAQDSRISLSIAGEDASGVTETASKQAYAENSGAPAVSDASELDSIGDKSVLSDGGDTVRNDDSGSENNAGADGSYVSSDSALTEVKANVDLNGEQDDKLSSVTIVLIAAAFVLLAAFITAFAIIKKKHTNSAETRAENAGDTGTDIKSDSDAEK